MRQPASSSSLRRSCLRRSFSRHLLMVSLVNCPVILRRHTRPGSCSSSSSLCDQPHTIPKPLPHSVHFCSFIDFFTAGQHPLPTISIQPRVQSILPQCTVFQPLGTSSEMHHILLMFLLGACSALARPSKDVEMLVSSDYGPLDDALQDNENLEQELLRRFYNGARLRLHRKVYPPVVTSTA